MKEKEEARLLELKKIDKEFFDKGIEYIAGIDEAGRGPLAGPVVVASVILPQDSMIEGVPCPRGCRRHALPPRF